MMKISKTTLNVYNDGAVKVRDQCYITWKYRGSSNRDCNIKVN